MITEQEFNRQVKEYENMTPEQKTVLDKNWELFQTKFRLCIYLDEVPVHPGNKYSAVHQFCSAGSMSGHCAFSGCPKVEQVLKL